MRKYHRWVPPLAAAFFFAFGSEQASAQNAAERETTATVAKPPDATSLTTADVQVLLWRHGYPPGLIDGASGEMTREALWAFQENRGIGPTGQLDMETAVALLQGQPDETFIDYTIAPEDVEGPFGYEFPEGGKKMKVLPPFRRLSPLHALADQFHITRKYLRELNPEAQWKAGETIRVPNLD